MLCEFAISLADHLPPVLPLLCNDTTYFLLCWCHRTINKCQGQTLRSIAVVLAEPVYDDNQQLIRFEPQGCFAHGQLTVALTRVGHPDRVTICLDPVSYELGTTPCPIYPEALLHNQRTATDTAAAGGTVAVSEVTFANVGLQSSHI